MKRKGREQTTVAASKRKRKSKADVVAEEEEEEEEVEAQEEAAENEEAEDEGEEQQGGDEEEKEKEEEQEAEENGGTEKMEQEEEDGEGEEAEEDDGGSGKKTKNKKGAATKVAKKEEEEAAEASAPPAAAAGAPAQVAEQSSTNNSTSTSTPDDTKFRFGFKPSAAPRFNKALTFKKLATSSPSANAAPPKTLALQRPAYPRSASDASTSFFVGTTLPPPAVTSSTTTSTNQLSTWGEWEWNEEDEDDEALSGEWPLPPRPSSTGASLVTAFNAIRLRRWMDDVMARQEVHFVEDLRRRTEQERERIKEQREKEQREREKKEKEEADAAAAATAAASTGATTAATTTTTTGKKKPAAKTTTSKRKGAQTATAAASTTAAAGAGKTTKGKATKAKAAKPAKKTTKGKGKANAKKDDALMTADGVKKEEENDKEEEMLQDIDESYLNLWERLRLARIRSKNEDSTFAKYAAYPIDHLTDIKSSLTVNLYPNGFSLGGSNVGEQQSMSYPYDSSTKDFIKTIDSLRLPPDFVELLEEVPCVYYDGCLVVEVRDFRGSSTVGMTVSAPIVRRVLLQPDTETIVSDVEQICAEHADWTSDDCLKIEQSIVLATAPPLCLEPDLKVAMAANVLNYNKCKYNLSRTAKKQAMAMHDARGEKAAIPKKGGVSFALMDFLSKKNYRPGSQSSYDNDALPIRKPLKDVDKNKKVSLLQLSLAHVRNIKKAPYLPKRSIQFHGREGRSYCYLELRSNASLNGYEALISEGVSAETAQENPTPFPIGNSKEADLFFNQIKTLYAREGKICIYDSGIGNRAVPLPTPAPAGPSQPMRPTPQQQAAYMSLMRRSAAPGGTRPPLNPNHPLFQQLTASQNASANQFRAAAAAAAQAAGQQQAAFEGRNYMPMSTPAGYAMASSGAPPGGMPTSMPSGMPGQASGHPAGQMSGMPMSPQSTIPHSGQTPGAPMTGPPLTPGSQQAPPPTGQMGPGGPVQSAMGQVSGAPVPGMTGMVGGAMGAGQMGGPPVMYTQPGGMPPGAPGGMNPMMATYRRGSSAAAPMRGQATMRGRAMPTAGGPMPQGQGMVGMTTTGVPSPSTMGPPSSPSLTSPSTPTMGGPMTPNAMPPSQPMGMAPQIGMQQPGGVPMAPMSPPGMMPNPMGGAQNMPMQAMPPSGMPQGMPTMTTARPQHPLERKFLLENVQQRK